MRWHRGRQTLARCWGRLFSARRLVISYVNDETEALLAALNAQREHVLGTLDGLSDDDLRRPVLPSGWTALGVVQHLTLEVERFCFRSAVSGEPMKFTSGDEAWQVPVDVPSRIVLDRYRDEIANSNAII